MSEMKVLVPEGMLKAAQDVWMIFADYPCDPSRFRQTVLPSIAAALRWLSENPVVPTNQQYHLVFEAACRLGTCKDQGAPQYIDMMVEWQRHMFLASEPEAPEEIADLMVSEKSIQGAGAQSIESAIKQLNQRTLEAFRRGQVSAK